MFSQAKKLNMLQSRYTAGSYGDENNNDLATTPG